MAFASINFFSKSLKRTVPINVVIPSDKFVFPGMPVPEKKPFKTLYLLHGVFGDYTDWVHGTRLQAIANNKNLCVVMPSGDNKFYADSSRSGDFYGKFITEDLVEFIEDTFFVSKKKEDRFIGGLSMGGFGAVTNALRRPDIYSRVIMLSAALIKEKIIAAVDEGSRDIFTRTQYEVMFDLANADDFAGSVNDYDFLADGLKDSAEKPEIYMACGTEDGLFPSNEIYRDRLLKDHFKVTWVQGPGVHNWAFWDEYIEKAIDWLPLGQSVQGISSENVSVTKKDAK